MVPLLTGEGDSIRPWALSGVYGRQVHVTDGHMKYARSPAGQNAPLSMWSNRWSTMPLHFVDVQTLPLPDRRATLDYMPGSDVPVILFSSAGSVDAAVSAIKAGADDFIPSADMDLEDLGQRVARAIEDRGHPAAYERLVLKRIINYEFF